MTEKIRDRDDLPDGWEEVYYSERDFTHGDETFRLVKALYEHVPTALKVAVCPHGSIQLGEKPSHRLTLIVPLYDRVGLYIFEDKAKEIESVLSSIIPRYNPADQYKPEENVFGRQSDHVSYRCEIEDEFDWGKYPQRIRSSLKTLKQYPLDYSLLLENHEGVHSATRLEDCYPGLISQPIQSRIMIGENTSGEKEIQFEDGSSIDAIIDPQSHIKQSKIDPGTFDEGTVLAHVELTIDLSLPHHLKYRTDRYGTVRIESIRYTDNGSDLMPLTARVRQRVKAMIG